MKILYFHCEKLKISHGFDSLYAHINDLFAYKNYFFTKQTEQLLFYLGSVHLIIVREMRREESFNFPSFGPCKRMIIVCYGTGEEKREFYFSFIWFMPEGGEMKKERILWEGGEV